MTFPEFATLSRALILFTLSQLMLVSSHAEDFKATIRASGTDGDLVRVAVAGKEQTLRLYGVACPVGEQGLAGAATTRILEAAMDAPVSVEIVGKDSAGNPLAWVRLPDGASLNEQLLREGLAWWDAPNTPEARALQQANSDAIATRRGLWAEQAPLAPWDYRASHGLPAVRYEKPDTTRQPSKTKTTRPSDIPSLKARGEKDDDDDDDEKGGREHVRGEKEGGRREHMRGGDDDDDKAGGSDDDDDDDDDKAGGSDDDDNKGERQSKNDYFPEDPAEHMALMLKHQPRIAFDTAGKPMGLTATDISSVPGAHRVGLQDGDIVSTVNGIALTDEAQVLGLVTQLQGVKQLDLTVIRQGKPTKITIPLE